jgi:AmiR/NasT family two-component response regulator
LSEHTQHSALAPPAGGRDTGGMDEAREHLRVLIADEDERRIAEIAGVISGLGHTVVARLLDVSEIAEATRRENPDVAIVGLGGAGEHALDLISAIVKQAACPVIVDLETDDDTFIDQAASRGIFAYVKHGKGPEMRHAIGIVLNRYAEFSRLHGALRTGATIEQAKGILMERHGITADQAFGELRARARNTNETVFNVAEAVTLSYPLFKARPIDPD